MLAHPTQGLPCTGTKMKKVIASLNKDLYPMNLIQMGFLILFASMLILSCILPEGTIPFDPACKYDPTCRKEIRK